MSKPLNLEDKIQNAGGVVNMLRASNYGPPVFPGIPPEFTSWRDEQQSWRTSVCLLELSYHMTELHIRGADAKKFVSQFASNRMDNLVPMRGKQLVLLDETGYLVSDCIMFCEADDFLRIAGPPTASNWLQFHAENTDLNIEVTRNENMIIPRERRDVFRFQLQGPNALDLVREVADDGLPEIKFFHIGEFNIAGHTVRALRHGMAGKPGFEIYGPWDALQAVRAKVEEVGARYGLRKAGSLAYATTGQESGWMARPLPAIYTGDHNKSFREWLPAKSFEGNASIGGSLVVNDVSEVFVEPYELSYGKMVNFDHDFVGRDALMARKTNARTKVTLELNSDDVFRVMKDSITKKRPRTKFISLPIAHYATFQCDSIMLNGNRIGQSHMACFSTNAGAMLTTALVENDVAEIGREVILLWGDGYSHSSAAEGHEMAEIRAKIMPVPYFEKEIKRD